MAITVSGFSVTLKGRVRETTQTTGTGTYSLDGAPTGKVTFVAGIGNGVHTLYTVEMGANFETGIGLVSSGAPATVARSLILESTNSNSAVNWGSGVKDIFVDAAAALFESLQDQVATVPVTRTKATAFTANGTLTTDADTVFAWVRIVGGGGAGGGTLATVANAAAEGGGGGGGEYAEGFFTAAQLGASKSVTIGSGGTGVLQGNGNAGGTTNFGSGLLTALGGSGGSQSAGGTGDGSYNGGEGGTGGTGGFFRSPGDDGTPGSVRLGRRATLTSGGGTRLGATRTIDAVSGTGRAGRNYGGGGTGASEGSDAPARAGGAGAPGYCVVIEYLHQ